MADLGCKNAVIATDYIGFCFQADFWGRRNVDIPAEFLKAVLDTPDSEYDHITIIDSHVKKESQDDKYGIPDVKLHTKSGTVINVEIQVCPIPEMKHRSVYFISKMVTEQTTRRAWICLHKETHKCQKQSVY